MHESSSAMRPRTFFEIIDESLRHYRARFVPLLMPWLPQAGMGLVLAAVGLSLQGSIYTDPEMTDFSGLFGLLGVTLVLSLAAGVVWILGLSASVFLTASQLDGAGEITPGQAWRLGSGRFWAMLLLFVIAGLAMTLAMILTVVTIGLFLIVVVWVTTRWIVSVQALLLEDAGAGEALSRSWDLTRGNFWRALGIAAVLYAMTIVISAPAQILGFLPMFFLEDGEIANTAAFYGTMAVAQTLGVLLNLVLSPLAALMFTHLYVDLRIRREAVDFQARFERMDRREGDANGGPGVPPADPPAAPPPPPPSAAE